MSSGWVCLLSAAITALLMTYLIWDYLFSDYRGWWFDLFGKIAEWVAIGGFATTVISLFVWIGGSR